ncbi:MAG: crossover junction endodeoxyribonuclease RuvC, partial [Clostridia bacterium]|nr:crossover junction endodeoxyribonuclease RuvC [Clostridia bacterium]
MIILGIDPGIAIVGWGVLEYNAGRFRPIAYDSIQTPSTDSTEQRL